MPHINGAPDEIEDQRDILRDFMYRVYSFFTMNDLRDPNFLRPDTVHIRDTLREMLSANGKCNAFHRYYAKLNDILIDLATNGMDAPPFEGYMRYAGI